MSTSYTISLAPTRKRQIRNSLLSSGWPTKDIPRKKAREGAYDDDDIAALESAKQELEDKRQRKDEERAKQAAVEDKEWQVLQTAWQKNPVPEPPSATGMKVFGVVVKVTQLHNDEYDTYRDFVGAFENEGAARMCHPGHEKNACEYRVTSLERNMAWANAGGLGPAPGWYLGPFDTWCHGAYVDVEVLCPYVIPEGEKPKYGIWCSSFRAG